MKKLVALVIALIAVLSACESEADQANANLTKEAEQFKVERRITAINGITDEVLFTVQGYCSYEVPGDGTFEVICKVDKDKVDALLHASNVHKWVPKTKISDATE